MNHKSIAEFVQKGARQRVTGGTTYLDDMAYPGMLHGSFLRAEVGRARILCIDTSKALALPGVVRIFSFRDFPDGVPRFGPQVMDQPVLAAGAVKYAGEPVVLVAAQSKAAADRAAAAVEIEYEPQRPLLSWEEACSDELIHDPSERPVEQASWRKSNIMGQWDYGWGTVDGRERDCAFVIDNTYRAPFAHHFTMEPHAALCIPDGEGLTVLSAVQHPFVARRVIAEMLSLPLSRVRVQSVNLGGGFGAKGYPKLEPVVSLFAWLLKRPLRITLSAEEAFFTAQREAAHIHIRSGFNGEGGIVFQDIEADYLVGAYTDISPRVVSKAGLHAAGPYRCANTRIRARGLFTTTPPTTAFRGFGSAHTSMALECQMNAAAARLGVDPLKLRLDNLLAKGESLVPGELPVDGDWADLFGSAAEAIGWHDPKGKGRGRGIAFGMKASVPATASFARVTLNADAGATLYVGTTEMGQGAITTLARIAAQQLNLPLERVTVMSGDTALVPFDSMTAASRSTVHMGNAVIDACAKLRGRLADLAAEVYGVSPDQVVFRDGALRFDGREVELIQMLKDRFGVFAGEVSEEGFYAGKQDPSHPLGGPAPFFEAVVTAVELHVDEQTGLVTLHKMVHVTDIGKVINPQRARGVDEGGNAMGIGVSLTEYLVYGADGRLLNGSSLDYRVPTSADMPQTLISLFQEHEDGPGPSGAKGLGEGGILAVAPAILGAVQDCCGIFLTEIPCTPETIWRTLRQRSAKARNREVG